MKWSVMSNGRYLSILEEIKKHGGDSYSNNPNEKVLIIDGLNTFIRVFSVIPTTNDDGIHVGGIVGFLKSVGYAIKMLSPTRTIIVFDGKGGSNRRSKLYPEYKAKRTTKIRLNRVNDFENIEDERHSMMMQLSRCAEYLEKLPVNIVSVDNKVPDNSLIRKILDDDNCKLGEYSCVGFQKHINNVDEIELFENMMFETYSLGKIKNKIANTEPIFRNSDFMDINVRSVKSGDINNSHEFTNGLSSYEFCTLSRFAGLSSNLDLISFSSSYQSSAISSLISEGIWYAIDVMNNVIY